MANSLWINAGELSGEMHGAALARALLQKDPSLTLTGMGGDMMAQAGVDLRFRVEELSIMGFTEVLGHIPRILELLSRIRAAMEQCRPRAVVVIDAPDFSFRVIKIAESLGIPVYYYISPKVWAWRQGRAAFIKRHVRRLIGILPFEVPFYKGFGMDIDYVGNPLVDMVDYPSIRHIEPDPATIGILPGSRKREVASLMPEFGKAARLMLEREPGLSFVCIRAPNVREDTLRGLWPEDVPLTVLSPDNRWAAMRRCRMLIAASGTVTLESAIAGVPTLVTYKVSPVSYLVGLLLIKVPYISLTNLIAGEAVFPELIQSGCDAGPLAQKALAWLGDKGDEELALVGRKLDGVREALGPPGAAGRAADVILNDLEGVE